MEENQYTNSGGIDGIYPRKIKDHHPFARLRQHSFSQDLSLAHPDEASAAHDGSLFEIVDVNTVQYLQPIAILVRCDFVISISFTDCNELENLGGRKLFQTAGD